ETGPVLDALDVVGAALGLEVRRLNAERVAAVVGLGDHEAANRLVPEAGVEDGPLDGLGAVLRDGLEEQPAVDADEEGEGEVLVAGGLEYGEGLAEFATAPAVLLGHPRG